VGLTGTTEKGTVEIVIEVMITVVDTTEVMTMIEGMTADMIVVTMIRGMNAITVVIVTIETTEGAGHRLARDGVDWISSVRSMITRFAD
jgi:hypothetical protein